MQFTRSLTLKGRLLIGLVGIIGGACIIVVLTAGRARVKRVLRCDWAAGRSISVCSDGHLLRPYG